jgi:hypothetical protein
MTFYDWLMTWDKADLAKALPNMRRKRPTSWMRWVASNTRCFG